MNLSFLKLHRSLLLILVVMLTSVLTLTLSYGHYKGHSQIDWFDVGGEGGITAMTLLWIFFILLIKSSIEEIKTGEIDLSLEISP